VSGDFRRRGARHTDHIVDTREWFEVEKLVSGVWGMGGFRDNTLLG
jgi:hypothetical protein